MEENKTAARGEDIITSRNVIIEALEAGRIIDSIYVARDNHIGPIDGIIAKAKQSGILAKDADPKKLDYLYGHVNHQGVVVVAAAKECASPEDLSRVTEERGKPLFFLIVDELEDPHDLGTILCMVECSGAHGVTVPRCHIVDLTFAVGKASAGAVEYVPVAQVTNLPSTLEELKKYGVWTYAADMDDQDWCNVDYRGPTATVIGSEGFGVSRLIREKLDLIISLPMLGKINLLNASVVCGVVCYEAVRQHRGIRAK